MCLQSQNFTYNGVTNNERTLGENLGQKNEILLAHVSKVWYIRDLFTRSLKGNIMLKNITAWLKSNPTVRIDARAYMACMFDLRVSSDDETMFHAAWNMATLSGQAGAATEAIVETAKKEEVAIVAWHDRNSHVLAYGAALGVARRAANAVRHDLGRSFSRRFF